MANSLRGQTTVDVGDQSFDVLLNMNAFRLMCQDKGFELHELDEFVKKNALDFIPTMVYWGVMNAADLNGRERPDVTFDRIAAVVLADMDKFQELSEAIGASVTAHQIGDDGKK